MAGLPVVAESTSDTTAPDPLGVLGPPGLRIMLRPMASPMPLGLYTVAIATVLVSSLQLGIIPPSEQREVAFLILPAFALQLIVGIACIAARDTIAATLMASISGTWLAVHHLYHHARRHCPAKGCPLRCSRGRRAEILPFGLGRRLWECQRFEGSGSPRICSRCGRHVHGLRSSDRRCPRPYGSTRWTQWPSAGRH
jgi:hypothetical protein